MTGPAAAGKGTLAATLAQKYRLAYFDTGMVYRAVGLEMRLSGKEIKDEAAAAAFARSLTFPRMMELSRDPRFRDDVGGQYASIVAAMPEVRAALLQMQQDFALRPGFWPTGRRLPVPFMTGVIPERLSVPVRISNSM